MMDSTGKTMIMNTLPANQAEAWLFLLSNAAGAITAFEGLSEDTADELHDLMMRKAVGAHGGIPGRLQGDGWTLDIAPQSPPGDLETVPKEPVTITFTGRDRVESWQLPTSDEVTGQDHQDRLAAAAADMEADFLMEYGQPGASYEELCRRLHMDPDSPEARKKWAQYQQDLEEWKRAKEKT
jgi:hypothetical protein